MSKFKNMKIAITPEQQLDEVVVELERLGYQINGWLENRIIRSVKTNHFGLYSGDFFDVDIADTDSKTLVNVDQIVNVGGYKRNNTGYISF